MKSIYHIALILLITFVTGSLHGNDSAPDNNITAKVMVYPNPVNNGVCTITSDQKIDKIQIFSILGLVVFTKDVDDVNTVKLQFDLESGIYILKVILTDNTYDTKRIWVN
jgi:hypothetical protein